MFYQDLEKIAKVKRQEFELEARNVQLSKALTKESPIKKVINFFNEKTKTNTRNQCCTN
jgi:hypothetical protein